MNTTTAIDRREALQSLAAGFGAALVPAVGKAIAAGIDPASSPKGAPALSIGARRQLVASLADQIIPKTDTPGAIGAGVPRFIDLMLTDFYGSADRARFLTGVDDFADASKRRFGKRAGSLSAAEFTELLSDMEAASPEAPEKAFFEELKQLTLLGYYSSEVGLSEEREYVAVPGRYDGAVPYTPGDKIVV